MREVFFLIGRGGAILYADRGVSATRIADSRARWEAIWAAREELEVLAHSHPHGPAAFSEEDISTMAAIDSALGKVVRYMVVAPAVTIDRAGEVVPEPWWADLLRLASGMKRKD